MSLTGEASALVPQPQVNELQPNAQELQDVVMTNVNGDDSTTRLSPPKTALNASPAPYSFPFYSPATAEILKRVTANSQAAATAGTPGWEAAREQVLKNMMTSDKFPTPPPHSQGSAKRGRGGKTPSALGNGNTTDQATPGAIEVIAYQVTPVSSGSRGRGRGRGVGRGRGRGAGTRGGTRGGKRKGGEDEIKAEDQSDDSETYTPLATMTKSGRAVTKPTSFAPPLPSPASGVKRKRPMNKKNPELAVCKVCLRPHSPATNMIVFCDGCNTPYHRYCHHPPIDQEVVDVPEKEWFCAECKVERAPTEADIDLDTFVSGEGASQQQV